jgi:hypothetical protein
VRIGIVVALCALVLPAGAFAKGPTAATITGPGLAKPLKLGGGPHALANGSPMQVLMMRGGFFQVAWGTQPRRTRAKRPTKELGPKYDVVYVVPGPSGQDDRIRQELYPHAQGGPVTYTPAGQRFFDSRRTHGGWFRADSRLRTVLVAAGLPTPASRTTPPAAHDDDGAATPFALWALLATLALAGIAALALRRRARPASA